MGKVWDIIPPRPKPKSHPPKVRRSKKKVGLFLGFILIILVAFLLLEAAKNIQPKIDGVSTTSPVLTNQGLPPNAQPSIKILNGSGESEKGVEIEQILVSAGFEVAKTENALNLYDQTIVYYQEAQEAEAEKIVESLKNLGTYQAKKQKFAQDTTYEIVVVIGSN